MSDAGNGDAGSDTATPTEATRALSQMSNVQHTVTDVSGGTGGKVRFTWDDPSEDFIGKYQYRYDGQSNNPGEGNWDQDWKDFLVSSATTTSYPRTIAKSCHSVESSPGPSFPPPPVIPAQSLPPARSEAGIHKFHVWSPAISR